MGPVQDTSGGRRQGKRSFRRNVSNSWAPEISLSLSVGFEQPASRRHFERYCGSASSWPIVCVADMDSPEGRTRTEGAI